MGFTEFILTPHLLSWCLSWEVCWQQMQVQKILKISAWQASILSSFYYLFF